MDGWMDMLRQFGIGGVGDWGETWLWFCVVLYGGLEMEIYRVGSARYGLSI